MPRRSRYTSIVEASASSGHYLKNAETAAYISAFRSLTSEDRLAIDGLVTYLSDTVPGMGIQGALELLAKFGIFMFSKPHEFQRLEQQKRKI